MVSGYWSETSQQGAVSVKGNSGVLVQGNSWSGGAFAT